MVRFIFLNHDPVFGNNDLEIVGGLMWGVERSLSRLKPTNEIGHRNEIGTGLAARGKSKKGVGCRKKEVKPHA